MARKPAPFTQAQVEAQLAGRLSVEEIAAVLDRLGLPDLGDLLPQKPKTRAPVNLSSEELMETAKGVTPKAVARRLPTRVGGEDLPLPDPPRGRPPDVPPRPGIAVAGATGG